jgi:hypothetical protein
MVAYEDAQFYVEMIQQLFQKYKGAAPPEAMPV